MDIFKGADELKPFLNYTWLRHKVILSNIANADTPGYRAKDVIFRRELGKTLKLKRTRAKHLGGSGEGRDFKVIEINRGLVGNDRNNVSIEEEMAKMVKNRLAYETYMKMATGYLRKLENVIKEGRR